jgi:hypothetical protein
MLSYKREIARVEVPGYVSLLQTKTEFSALFLISHLLDILLRKFICFVIFYD